MARYRLYYRLPLAKSDCFLRWQNFKIFANLWLPLFMDILGTFLVMANLKQRLNVVLNVVIHCLIFVTPEALLWLAPKGKILSCAIPKVQENASAGHKLA